MKRSRIIALLAATLFLGALAPHAPTARAASDPPTVATLTIDGPDGPIVIPLTDGEAARFALFEDFTPPASLDALSIFRAATASVAIDYAADPDALFAQLGDAYQSYLQLYDVWLQLDRAQALVVDDESLADVSTHMTLLFPDANLSIDMTTTVTSSDMDVLHVKSFSPVPQLDGKNGDILIRKHDATPVRITAASEGSARLVFIFELTIQNGDALHGLSQSISLPVTVRAQETPWWQEQLTQPRPSVSVRASDVLTR